MPDEETLPPFTSTRVEAIREPIPGDAPAGIDVAYEDDFMSLKDEVDAMGAATGDVDFQNIVDLATTILSKRSKDIAVACYLAFGLSRTTGYAGILEGVASVRAVVETYWEAAFPPLRRMRARQSAIQFMAERLSAWAETHKATPGERETLEQTLEELTALQTFTTESMGDDAPPLSGLSRTIREALRRLPAPKKDDPEPSADAPAASAPGESASSPAAPASAIASSAASGADSSFSTRSEADGVVLRVAGFVREASATDATAVLLTRAIMWGGIQQPPPSEGGRTKIPAPQAARRSAITSLAAAGNHEGLATACEQAVQEAPFHFWLDLQRMAASAFGALGVPGAAAQAAVVDSTASLNRRLPVLATLSYSDGTPFADPLTVSWLDEISASDGEGGGSHGDDSSRDAIREAQSKAGSGDVPGAVATLIAGAGAPRDKFERVIAAAEMCLGAGRADVALALLDDADNAIRKHQLDVWDPSAARNALRLLHASCSALLATAGSPDRKLALSARADEAFARLARLDPGLAMRASAAPKKG